MLHQEKIADIVILSSNMFQAINRFEQPFSGGIAIKGQHIIAVGKELEIEPYIGDKTKVYKFGKDSTLMPGICDSHLHLPETILAESGPMLRYVKSEEECIENVKKWHQENPQMPWIIGFGWHHFNWKSKTLPTKKLLSEAITDVPVALFDVDLHAVWVNQKALDEVGFDANTSDPNGILKRFSDGSPSGWLEEEFSFQIKDVATAAVSKSEELRKKQLSIMLQKLNQRGITSVMDALGISEDWYKTIDTLLSENKLPMRISTVCYLNDSKDPISEGKALSEKYPDKKGKISFWGYKLLTDGVGNIHTAWMLEPYGDAPDNFGYPYTPPEKMRELILSAEKEGFGVHVHAVGDRSTRFTLDIFEEAKNLGYIKNQRNTITHLDCVNEKDFKRFGELGIIASVQPSMLTPTLSFEDNSLPQIFGPGERFRNCWATKRLFESAKVVSFSSDSPVTGATIVENLFAATQRKHPSGTPVEGINPDQRVSVADCLWAYTYGGAYQLGREDVLGTLEAGKLADVVVFNKNLFACDPHEYWDLASLLTIVDGEVVFEK